jgi:hypothetical protein
MPISFEERVNLERGLNDEQISEVRFGRSRFLRNASLAFFGLAAGVLVPTDPARADPPPGCHGGPACKSCERCYCANCRRRAWSCGGKHCWRTVYNGRCYKCCDWISGGGFLCICRCRVRC